MHCPMMHSLRVVHDRPSPKLEVPAAKRRQGVVAALCRQVRDERGFRVCSSLGDVHKYMARMSKMPVMLLLSGVLC